MDTYETLREALNEVGNKDPLLAERLAEYFESNRLAIAPRDRIKDPEPFVNNTVQVKQVAQWVSDPQIERLKASVYQGTPPW
jgi:hypothetical protein